MKTSYTATIKSRVLTPFIGLVLLAAFAIIAINTAFVSPQAQAQTNCSPATDFGLVTKTVDIPTTGTYHIWSRMKHADGNPSYIFHMDGAGGFLCDQTVSGSGSANEWIWEEAPGTIVWNGGTATISLSGNKAGVGLDCVVLTTDATFTPKNADDCASSGDTTNPTIGITVSDNTIANTDTFDITVDAEDETELDRVEYYVDGALDHTATTAPYTYNWDIRDLSVLNADYEVTAKAVDTSQNEATTAATTIKVRHPDIDRDGLVSVPDLVIMINKWNSTTNVETDLDGSGSIGLGDLTQMIIRWQPQ